ncbi:molecular chaperone TorD, partial [Escherichia coli]
ARLELAADFCGLFLMTDKQAALPYASAYKQDEQEIKRLLVEAGMETSGNFNEPADHLAIYLELLSHLHFSLGEGTVPARRIDSLRQKTLTALWQWLPEFAARCHQYDSFGFYAALSQLLLVLVECDHQNR